MRDIYKNIKSEELRKEKTLESLTGVTDGRKI